MHLTILQTGQRWKYARTDEANELGHQNEPFSKEECYVDDVTLSEEARKMIRKSIIYFGERIFNAKDECRKAAQWRMDSI